MNLRLEHRKRLARWVSEAVMPHEPAVRRWLAKSRVSPSDVDELIQDSYCHLAKLDTFDHIVRADSYFFAITRNLLLRRIKRATVVPISALSDVENLVDDSVFTPEREVDGRMCMNRLVSLMEELPERCREVIRLRKIEGHTQREIAGMLGITENMVENDIQAGIRKILSAWRQQDEAASARLHALEAGTKH